MKYRMLPGIELLERDGGSFLMAKTPLTLLHAPGPSPAALRGSRAFPAFRERPCHRLVVCARAAAQNRPRIAGDGGISRVLPENVLVVDGTCSNQIGGRDWIQVGGAGVPGAPAAFPVEIGRGRLMNQQHQQDRKNARHTRF